LCVNFPTISSGTFRLHGFSNVEKPINTVQEVADLVVNMAALLDLEQGDQHRKGHSKPDIEKKAQSSVSFE
jgi:hypothetical protein